MPRVGPKGAEMKSIWCWSSVEIGPVRCFTWPKYDHSTSPNVFRGNWIIFLQWNLIWLQLIAFKFSQISHFCFRFRFIQFDIILVKCDTVISRFYDYFIQFSFKNDLWFLVLRMVQARWCFGFTHAPIYKKQLGNNPIIQNPFITVRFFLIFHKILDRTRKIINSEVLYHGSVPSLSDQV